MRYPTIPTLIGAAALALAVTAPSASATTFCVGGFTAHCPDNGGNVLANDLTAALTTDASDGQPDKAMVKPGIYSSSDGFSVAGTDPLEIAGAGTSYVTLTVGAAATGKTVLGLGTRPVDLHSVTVSIPATDTGGAGVYANDDTIEQVIVRSRTAKAWGVYGDHTATLDRVLLEGADGGGFDYGVYWFPASSDPETLTLTDSDIHDADTAVRNVEGHATVNVLRNRISVRNGDRCAVQLEHGTALVSDSLILTAGPARGACATASGGQATTLTLRNATIVGAGGYALSGAASGPAGSKVKLSVLDSIINGFAKSADRAVADGSAGSVDLEATHSNLPPYNLSPDAGTVEWQDDMFTPPHFVGGGDYRLLKGSPSIDTADPGAAGGERDANGAQRNVDGNGDGIAVRDQGAYEFQPSDPDPIPDPTPSPQPTPQPTPAPGGGDGTPQPMADVTAPVLSGLSARLHARRGSRVRIALSEAARLQLVLKPKRAGRRTVKVSADGAAGANALRIRRHALKRGRYVLTLVATDAAGNRSAVLRAKLRVRR